MKQILEKMNRGKFFGWFYRILGLVILIDLLCNNDDAFGEIAGWTGIAALAILTGRSLYILIANQGNLARISKKEEQTLLLTTFLCLALYMIMKNPFDLPLPWVVYGTLLFLVTGLALATYVLLRKNRS